MKRPAKTRLDQLLVERALVVDLKSARARIMLGDVLVNDHRIDKPGDKFNPDCQIRLRDKAHPFVSRGGLKLEQALKLWPAQVACAVCIDVGASTGGFSEVLLLNQAKLVYAVDVGHGQLADKLRLDPRIKNIERTHILELDQALLSERPSIAVIDVSFISLTRVLPKVVELLAPEAYIYALIKPQFEVRADLLGPGGIVRDPEARQQAVDKIIALAKNLGLTIRGVAPSPILGTKGNAEFLLALSCASL